MVLLTTTPTILHAISLLPPTSPFHSDHSSLPTCSGSPIPHSTLISLSRCLCQSQSTFTLNTLLRGAKPYIAPPPAKPEPTNEYKALMARLRAEQERKEYRAMVAKQEAESQQALSGQVSSESEEIKDDISPSLVLNILLSVVLCAGAVFHLTRWWPNDGVRVLVALGTAVVVGIAEVTVYAAYLRKVDESREKERRKREVKTFIGEYTGGGGDDDDGDGAAMDKRTSGEDIDKTEIWGKGVHGGMRRRVREKWEKDQRVSG